MLFLHFLTQVSFNQISWQHVMWPTFHASVSYGAVEGHFVALSSSIVKCKVPMLTSWLGTLWINTYNYYFYNALNIKCELLKHIHISRCDDFADAKTVILNLFLTVSAKVRSITVPNDLEMQLNLLLNKSQLVLKHSRAWLMTAGRNLPDGSVPQNKDYRNIIEGLQVWQQPKC